MMMPTSIARPPSVVTISACRAARRPARLVGSCPISRYEKTVVSSQKTYSTIRLSERTRPSIAPANPTNTPANRPSPGSSAGEVPGTVDQRQRADAADQQDHQPGQRGHPQRQVSVELPGPRVHLGDRAARRASRRCGASAHPSPAAGTIASR